MKKTLYEGVRPTVRPTLRAALYTVSRPARQALPATLRTACFLLFLALTSLSAFAQNPFNVKGTVTSETGEGLPGASVILKGTSTGTTTDVDGKYSLNVPDGSGTLVFTYIGYLNQEIALGNRSQLDVKLAPNDKTLEEIVVVGYGTQKKATLTGSVSEVKGADIVKSPQPNLSNSLAGRFSGFVANNRGGEPGYDGSSYTVRGFATTGNNDVLIVVDGIPGQVGGSTASIRTTSRAFRS